MPRIYLHEFVDVVGTRRAEYQHHMTANWCPEAGPLRRQACFGVFSLVGSTGRWPQVVNLWEYASWDDLAHNFSVELVGAGHRDPMLAAWWAEAASFRTGGFDRVMVAHPSSPSASDWADRGGTGAVAYVHELVRTTPGGAPELLDELVLGSHGPDEVHGLELVAAFTTAMRADDELLVLRALPDWSTWARVEAAAAASPLVPDEVVDRQRVLLVDAELSPLRIGRQPSVEDRRPLDSF